MRTYMIIVIILNMKNYKSTTSFRSLRSYVRCKVIILLVTQITIQVHMLEEILELNRKSLDHSLVLNKKKINPPYFIKSLYSYNSSHKVSCFRKDLFLFNCLLQQTETRTVEGHTLVLCFSRLVRRYIIQVQTQ